MDDLFEKLRSEEPVNNKYSWKAGSALSPPKSTHTAPDLKDAGQDTKTSASRKSSPSNKNNGKIIKDQNVSPVDCALRDSAVGDINNVKSLKVLLKRKSVEQFLGEQPDAKRKPSTIESEKHGRLKKPETSRRKLTPTKAEKKQFATAELVKDFKVKRCLVRVQRGNFIELRRDLTSKKLPKKERIRRSPKATKTKEEEEETLSPLSSSVSVLSADSSAARGATKKTHKRQNLSGDVVVNPAKRKCGFFIKLSPTKPAKAAKVERIIKATSPKSHKSPSPKVGKGSTPKRSKLSHTKLIRKFGKRVFNVCVRIERCKHPLMLTFESNARAREGQTKKSKSKKLSVSFRDQVEVFGESDSDEDSSYEESFCALPMNSSSAASSAAASDAGVAGSVGVMPARLEKVESGKVDDDIELNQSLFSDPTASTPFTSSLRKRREHRSFNPLKGDGTPSPRKEQLKLANEKLPPTGLRHLIIDDNDDDDDDDADDDAEDDGCEYIVPIEMPPRRSSYNSSIKSGKATSIGGSAEEDKERATSPPTTAEPPSSLTDAVPETEETDAVTGTEGTDAVPETEETDAVTETEEREAITEAEIVNGKNVEDASPLKSSTEPSIESADSYHSAQDLTDLSDNGNSDKQTVEDGLRLSAEEEENKIKETKEIGMEKLEGEDLEMDAIESNLSRILASPRVELEVPTNISAIAEKYAEQNGTEERKERNCDKDKEQFEVTLDDISMKLLVEGSHNDTAGLDANCIAESILNEAIDQSINDHLADIEEIHSGSRTLLTEEQPFTTVT